MSDVMVTAPEIADGPDRARSRKRERLALGGAILLGLLPVALLAFGIAVFVIGQQYAGAAGGCGGG